MNESPHSSRYWTRRIRTLRDRATRENEGVCFVEGIRQVVAAHEGEHGFEAVIIDPQRLRSTVAWRTVSALREAGVTVAELTSAEFERVSSRDNPAGIAAIVEWRPGDLPALPLTDAALYLVADQISDAGNLGTLIRTADSLGASGVIVHGGVDPTHPGALRASLGTAFHLPIAGVASLDNVFDWATQNQVSTVATSAKAQTRVWDTSLSTRVALLVGNEGEGLAPETIERCDQTVLIPMSGTATSLNVGVAAGIILYEVIRQRSTT